MKIKHYVITALVSYFIFLIYSVPASPVIQLLTENNKNLTVSAIEGTLWNGKAKSIMFKQHQINDLTWDFTPWRLLTTEVSFDIKALFQDKALTASIGTSLTNTVCIHNLSTTLDAFNVGLLANLPIGELAGQMNISIDSASWSSGSIPSIEGKILWEKSAIIVAERASLGELTILLTEGESPLNASIASESGQLDISGNADVAIDGNYNLEITLKPTSKASQNLRNSLKLVAKPSASGDYKINKSGNLSQYGLL